MKKRNIPARLTVLAILITCIVSTLGGCKSSSGEVSMGQEFTLSVGQTVAVTGENLSIKFVEVISDSRCPTGAVCIWAGEASCLLEVISANSTFSKVLTQPGASSPPQDSFMGYDVIFDIQPYPEVGKTIDKRDYRLKLNINKTPG